MGSLDDGGFSYYELSIRNRNARGWRWEVKSRSGRLLMHGQHRTRVQARYYGYRSLLLLLGASPRPQTLADGARFTSATDPSEPF